MLYVHVARFFVKQKTAYEMRISDWSSDVCSSDLPIQRHHIVLEIEQVVGNGGVHRHPHIVARNHGRGGQHPCAVRACAERQGYGPRQCGATRGDLPDRKSVVWGKSVSVRLDLGGVSIIKKKKINKPPTQTK